MDRHLNYLFGLIVIYLFVLEANMGDHVMIITGIALSALLAYFAFLVNWITLSAISTTIIVGTVALGFGGWMLACALVVFFVGSSMLTLKKEYSEQQHKSDDRSRRDSYQIWANGFWTSTFILLWFVSGSEMFLWASFASVAAAASDTWATELGTRNPGITKRITDFKIVSPGTDGGISLKGTLAAVGGSLSVALVLIFFGYVSAFILVFISGFLGCIADSYFGVIVSKNKFPAKSAKKVLPMADYAVKNNIVNWLATGTAGLIAILFTQLL